MGAREGGEAAPAVEQVHRSQVELLVAAHGGLELRPAPRERRRVEHDRAEARSGALEAPQLVEHVGGDDLGPVGDPVQREVLARAGERLRPGLDQDGAASTADEGVAGEAARVGEAVENVAAAGEG